MAKLESTWSPSDPNIKSDVFLHTAIRHVHNLTEQMCLINQLVTIITKAGLT